MNEDAHARPSGDAPEPLYDVDVPTPTHAERARTLIAQIKTGTLCTLAAEPEGYPYGSFVTVGFDGGDPVVLVSTMAEHTKNLQRDTRASLLVAEGGSEDPLANGRVDVARSCARVEGDGGSARAAFLAAPPNAAYYMDFGDFAFWKLRVESVRYIGGYGAHVLGRGGGLAGRRSGPAGRGRQRRDLAHERRPRRRDGAVLQGVLEGDRHRRRQHDGDRPLRLRDVGRDRGRPAARPPRVSGTGPHPGGGPDRAHRNAGRRQDRARVARVHDATGNFRVQCTRGSVIWHPALRIRQWFQSLDDVRLAVSTCMPQFPNPAGGPTRNLSSCVPRGLAATPCRASPIASHRRFRSAVGTHTESDGKGRLRDPQRLQEFLEQHFAGMRRRLMGRQPPFYPTRSKSQTTTRRHGRAVVLRRKTGCHVRCVERNPELVATARTILSLNGVADRVEVIHADAQFRWQSASSTPPGAPLNTLLDPLEVRNCQADAAGDDGWLAAA